MFCPRPIGASASDSRGGRNATAGHRRSTPRGPKSPMDFRSFCLTAAGFLDLAASHRPGESSIRVGSLDSAVSKPIVASETSALYAPVFGGRSACLLFVSHSSLLVQPLDHQTLGSSPDLRLSRRKCDTGRGGRPAFRSRTMGSCFTAGARTRIISSPGSIGRGRRSPRVAHATGLRPALIIRSTCRLTDAVLPFTGPTIRIRLSPRFG